VVVAVIGGVVYQFNDAFRTYARNYFGDYLACLLETGELPSLGGIGGGEGLCNERFQEFSLAEGRPLIGDGIGQGGRGGSSEGGDSFRDSSGEDNFGNSSSEGRSASGRSPTGGRGTRGGGGRSFRSGSSLLRSQRFRVSQGGEDSTYTGSTDASLPAWALQGQSGRIGIQRRQRFRTRYYLPKQDQEEDDGGKSTVAQKVDSQKTNQKKNRFQVQRKPQKTEPEKEGEAFTIGFFLRFLLIAGIIIALVVFLGGQALQISKSME